MLSLFWTSFLITAICALAVIYALLQPETTEGPLERLEQLVGRNRRGTVAVSTELDFTARSVSGLRTRFLQADDAELRKSLQQAGWRGEKAQELYTTARVALPGAGVLTAFLMPGPRLLWAVIVPVLLYVSLSFFLHSRIRKRRRTITRGIPDMLDLLVICVEAGLGIDAAVLRVATEIEGAHPELQEELLQIVREQRAGKPRQDAWREAVGRLEVPELEAFMNMMLQSERFGTPIAQALRNYAGGVQQKRVQSAEEKAAKTSIKIIFPLALFSFPSIFIVILGPAVLNLLRSF